MQGKSRKQIVENLQGGVSPKQAPVPTNSKVPNTSDNTQIAEAFQSDLSNVPSSPGVIRRIFPDRAARLWKRYQLDILEENLKSRLEISKTEADIRITHAKSVAYQIKSEIAVHMDNQRQRAQASIAASRIQWGEMKAYAIERAITGLMDLTEKTLNRIVDKQLDSESPLPEELLKGEIDRLYARHERRAKEIEGLEDLEIDLEGI